MTKRNALILSKDESISKIAYSELLLLGYSPKILKEMPTSSDAELIIFDATTIEFSAPAKTFLNLSSSKKIAILNNDTERLSARFDQAFTFPFSLSAFRGALLDIISKEDHAITNADTSNKKCFVCDPDKMGVYFGESYIPLSVYEFKLLSLLCENSGKCVSKNDILSLFEESSSNIAEVYICHLRNKLEIPFGTKVIYTVRGKGYMTDHILK